MSLTQVTNRIVEIYNAPNLKANNTTDNVEISDRQEDGSYAKLRYFDLTFRVKQVGQNFVLLKSGQAVKLISILKEDATVKLIGKPFQRRSSVYTEIDTNRFNIFKCREQFGDPIIFEVSDIDGKY